MDNKDEEMKKDMESTAESVEKVGYNRKTNFNHP